MAVYGIHLCWAVIKTEVVYVCHPQISNLNNNHSMIVYMKLVNSWSVGSITVAFITAQRGVSMRVPVK